MTVLDVLILAVAAAAGIGGWRLGFVPRLLAWAGVAIGLVVAVPLVPAVVTTFGGTSADTRVTAALAFVVLAAMVGQGIGLAVGTALRHAAGAVIPGRWDRVAGATLGVLGVLALVWMSIPSLSSVPGWPARAARDSFVVEVVDRLAPDQPERFAAWGRAVAEAPYPFAIDPLAQPPDVGAPPPLTIPAAADERARTASVRVTGRACNRVQQGTGWVAGDGIVVTNAHVVAGEDDSEVEDADGRVHAATVVAFDPRRDLAVLAVPTLDVPALRLAAGAEGVTGAVYGHPGGGPLRPAPARIEDEITAVGTDIYRTGESRRQVYVLAADLEPGDSGGALVDASGRVVGTAFAIDPGRDNTAYALAEDEVRAVLDEIAGAPVDTGPCLVR